MVFMQLSVYLCYSFRSTGTHELQMELPEGKIIHSPHSLALFRKMWKQVYSDRKNDSIIRIAVVSDDPNDLPLRDSIAAVLRNLFHDPRTECSWQWSNNWSPLPNNSISPFNRPSTFINLNSDSPHHDYINGWVQCKRNSPERNSLIRIIYKNEFPEIISTFSADTNVVMRQNISDDGNWHLLTWPMNSDSAMITIDGSKSPQIGNITVEPTSGFSIWTFRMPEKTTSSTLFHFRHQIDLVSPQLVILAASKNNFHFNSSLSICKKIFSTSQILCFSENGDRQIAESSLANGCAYLCGEKFSQTDFWKFVLQDDIKSCFR